MALERLELKYYRVVIDTPNLIGGSLLTTESGGIDNTTPEQYGATTGFPSDINFSLAKERGNMRYEEILRQVSENIQPVYVSAIVATAGDGDTEPTDFDFTLVYDRDEFVTTVELPGEASPGDTLTAEDAIKRWVERALTATIVQNRNIYDPTETASAIRNGPQIIEVTAGSLEAALPITEVTVTVIANIIPTV